MSFPFASCSLAQQFLYFCMILALVHRFLALAFWVFFLVLFLMTQVECSLNTSPSCTRMFFNALTSCQCQHLHLFLIFFLLKRKKKMRKRDTDLWTSFFLQAQFCAVMNLIQQWRCLRSLFNPEICLRYLDLGLQKCWAGKEYFTHPSATQQTVSTSSLRYLSGHLSAVKLLLVLDATTHSSKKWEDLSQETQIITGVYIGHCTPDFCVTKWALEM